MADFKLTQSGSQIQSDLNKVESLANITSIGSGLTLSNGELSSTGGGSSITVSSSGVTDGTNTYNAADKQAIISDLANIRSGATAGSTAVQPAAISDMATKTWVGDQNYLTEHQDISGKADKTYVDTQDTAIMEAAQGKTKSYVLNAQSDITGTKDANDQYTNVTAITGITLTNLKIGDVILIKALDVPDYWVSQILPSISLNKMETTKVDISTKQDTLTDTQLAAANSGITNTKVGTYDGYASSKMDVANPTGTGSIAVGNGVMASGENAQAFGKGYRENLTITAVSGNILTYSGYFYGKVSQTLCHLDENFNVTYFTITAIDTTNTTLTISPTPPTSYMDRWYLCSGCATGYFAHSEGNATTASGRYGSHAEGDHTIASGYYAHAEGYTTIASEQASHAEGSGTTASGLYSHAEGGNTIASGWYSHAEGEGNEYGYPLLASGEASHAEGKETTASGKASHSEGNCTTASGGGSHAEGNTTTASGNESHAEGGATVAQGTRAHAEGWRVLASGSESHAEGYGEDVYYTITAISGSTLTYGPSEQVAIGDVMKHYENGEIKYYQINAINTNNYTITLNSVPAQDTNNWFWVRGVAIGEASHAEGYTTIASGDHSHTEGYQTAARNESSHAEGYKTIASGNYGSHAEGEYTVANGIASHSEGNCTTASGGGSHAEGNTTTASGNESHAEGFNTIANHKSQHVFGEYNIIDDSSAAATSRGNYVEIVGNGNGTWGDPNERSNARTLDWSGNEVLAGSLKAASLTDGTTTKTMTEVLSAGGKLYKHTITISLQTDYATIYSAVFSFYSSNNIQLTQWSQLTSDQYVGYARVVMSGYYPVICYGIINVDTSMSQLSVYGISTSGSVAYGSDSSSLITSISDTCVEV